MTQMQVVVSDVRPPNEPGPHTVLIGTGRLLAGGQPVTFAGDQRQMWALRHALDDAATDVVVAVIEPWQVLGGSN